MNSTKCAVITGAVGGIGRAITETLAKEGYKVVLTDIDEEKLFDLAKKIQGYAIKTDLNDRYSCKKLIAKSIEKYGSVDILINNAGLQHISSIENFPEEKWGEFLNVMLTAPFLLIKYVWPLMKKKGWGRIVNIASIHGLVASPYKVAYVSAKHGLLGLTKTAALEGGEHGITVNALCPSYVRTALIENQILKQALINNMNEEEVVKKIMLDPACVKKLIEPQEIADLISFFCSNKSSAITGASWTIDCGWTAR